jgi:hypothetical protein
MTKAYESYKTGVDHLRAWREQNPGMDDPDEMLDKLDRLWDAMTREEREEFGERLKQDDEWR